MSEVKLVLHQLLGLPTIFKQKFKQEIELLYTHKQTKHRNVDKVRRQLAKQ